MRATLKLLAGASVCTLTAAALTVLLKDGGGAIRLAAPAICLQVVIVTALFWGRWPALLGAFIASLTFALWLFPPVGSLWINDRSAQIMLVLFQLAALGVTRISPRTSPRSCPPPRAGMIMPGDPGAGRSGARWKDSD